MPVVRDDHVGACGGGAGKELIVFGVLGNRADGRDFFDLVTGLEYAVEVDGGMRYRFSDLSRYELCLALDGAMPDDIYCAFFSQAYNVGRSAALVEHVSDKHISVYYDLHIL